MWVRYMQCNVATIALFLLVRESNPQHTACKQNAPMRRCADATNQTNRSLDPCVHCMHSMQDTCEGRGPVIATSMHSMRRTLC
jgi:hypothetical protein